MYCIASLGSVVRNFLVYTLIMRARLICSPVGVLVRKEACVVEVTLTKFISVREMARWIAWERKRSIRHKKSIARSNCRERQSI